MNRSVIIYPCPPPVPPVPAFSTDVLGALGGRTEYYYLTYVNADGETHPGVEGAITVPANSVAVISPPPYPRPFGIYGYNVYGGSSSGTEVLQNPTGIILAGDTWTEPPTGLLTGTPPGFFWNSTALVFGTYSYPTKRPAYQRSSVRHSNVAASGLLETIYEHTDHYTEFTIPWVQLGPDIARWDAFVNFAERGGIFSFLLDIGSGGDGTPKYYTLWDSTWDAAYKSNGFYTFKMKFREATLSPSSLPPVGGTVGGGGGGGGVTYVDGESPVDSGDHQNFTLAHAPSPPADLLLFLQGTGYYNQFLFPGGVDYTLSGTGITMTTPLSGSFILLAYYRY